MRYFLHFAVIPCLCMGLGLFVTEAHAQQQETCASLSQLYLDTQGQCSSGSPGPDWFSADDFFSEIDNLTGNGCPGTACWARRSDSACVGIGEILNYSPAACAGSASCPEGTIGFGASAACPGNSPSNPTANLCCGALGGDAGGSGTGAAAPTPASGSCIPSTICSPLCRISQSAVTPAITAEATRIQSENNTKPYGTQISFMADGKQYVGVIEEHTNCPDGSNTCPHPGTSVFSCDPSQAAAGTGVAGAAGAAGGAAGPAQRVVLPDPLGNVSFPRLAGGVIRTFSGVAGAVALLMFVYGGVMWIISGGESGKVKAARQILINAVIGLILIFGAYLFTSAIIESILANPN